jgi:hypothetical protein
MKTPIIPKAFFADAVQQMRARGRPFGLISSGGEP